MAHFVSSKEEDMLFKNGNLSNKLPEERDERIDSGFQSYSSLASNDKNSLMSSIPTSLQQVDEEQGTDVSLADVDEGIASLSLQTEKDETVTCQSDTKNTYEEDTEVPLLLRVFAEDEDGDTKLHIAVIHRVISLIKLFIEIAKTYDVKNELCLIDSQNSLSQTPLHLAVLTENNEAAEILMHAGADTSLQDHNGDTPLHIACRGANEETVSRILENTHPFRKQRLLETVNYDGQACIHLCNSSKHIETISELSKHGVDLNARENKAGWTLLHMAADSGNEELVNYLIRQPRVDAEECTFNDVTALMLAESKDRSIIVSFLETAGCQYNELESEPESDDET